MYKLLIIFAILFASCKFEISETKIKNLKIVSVTENGQVSSKYFGDYVKETGRICCEKCAITNSVAEQVQKNPEFSVNCVDENQTRKWFYLGGLTVVVICLILFMLKLCTNF
jgi:hypothetical protein